MNRSWWHCQLDVRAWPGPRISPANIVVVGLIFASVSIDVLLTEPTVIAELGTVLQAAEFWILVLFTLEYLLRLWTCVEDPAYAGWSGRLRFLLSPFALVDLIAILPSYIAWGGVSLTWMRTLRLLRIAKLARFGAFSLALDTLIEVVKNRSYELLVSVTMMVFLILVAAAGIYVVEGEAQPEAFGSVPRSMWWSVATLTTVGYGDVTPQSPLGRTLAAFVSLSGIALVAVPTGILAASFSEVVQKRADLKRDDRLQ